MHPKLKNWDGAKKARVRLVKKNDIFIWAVKKELNSKTATMLSFPGPKAVLERLLVNHSLVKPENITAIQTYENLSSLQDGEALLKQLINTRNRHLKGMYIWPYNFKSFSQNYGPTSCSKPANTSRAKWAKPPYKKFMDSLSSREHVKFSVVDLDLCGIFNSTNADSIENLFKNKALDNSGLLFITHQKGRDVRGGALFNILHEYLRCSHLIDIDSVPNINDMDRATYVARYILIPIYYICKAFEHGYILDLHRLIEYRDPNQGSGLAVNMLQYFFNWSTSKRDDSVQEVRQIIANIVAEKYMYINWVD